MDASDSRRPYQLGRNIIQKLNIPVRDTAVSIRLANTLFPSAIQGLNYIQHSTLPRRRDRWEYLYNPSLAESTETSVTRGGDLCEC